MVTVVVLALGCATAVATGWRSPLRAVLSLGFLLFGPGAALAELLDIRDLAQRLTIAVAASLGIETLLALVLVYAGAFSVTLIVVIVAALTLVMLSAAVLRVARFKRMSRHRSIAAE
jgi:uncharacterized membrane protein